MPKMQEGSAYCKDCIICRFVTLLDGPGVHAQEWNQVILTTPGDQEGWDRIALKCYKLNTESMYGIFVVMINKILCSSIGERVGWDLTEGWENSDRGIKKRLNKNWGRLRKVQEKVCKQDCRLERENKLVLRDAGWPGPLLRGGGKRCLSHMFWMLSSTAIV